MKLSEFTETLWRMISKEEKDLELPISNATINIACKRGDKIVFHSWEYNAKEVKE